MPYPKTVEASRTFTDLLGARRPPGQPFFLVPCPMIIGGLRPFLGPLRAYRPPKRPSSLGPYLTTFGARDLYLLLQ
ncbi:Uncharacterized protein TCM_026873 [Theobroma cacao]|uniref:Uncharacterized protein n=1 Tax=Theobroma cacao TaxID=3641 RepID=A0A061F4I6_THECC|nr:Uncharacterized protein TCM_026873 [Theobroma cacao]